jgi:hypothetical protein
MSTKPTEAGSGEHHVYRIVPAGTADNIKLTANKHYVGIDAVAWYINKSSGWFTDRLASGTLELRLASGLEKYQAALGTFELKDGAKVAPVFDRPVLPDRNYVGGTLGLNASLTAIKNDTVVGGMLKSAAAASLGVVAGMVQTASLAGPAKILASAGEDLIGGVKRVLTDTAANREPLFDFSGLDYTLQPDVVTAPKVYLLLHRGAALNEAELSVKQSGLMVLPYSGGQMLDDGAWLLLRLRRSDVYSGVRDWFDKARALRGKIDSLVSDVDNDVTPKADALKRLQPSGTGDATIFDEFAQLRSIIINDGVLSESEASVNVAQLAAVIAAARKAIAAHSAEQFKIAVVDLRNGLRRGVSVKGPIAKAFVTELHSFIGERRALVSATAPQLRKFQTKLEPRHEVTGDLAFAQMRYLSNSLLKTPKF